MQNTLPDMAFCSRHFLIKFGKNTPTTHTNDRNGKEVCGTLVSALWPKLVYSFAAFSNHKSSADE